MPNWNLFWQNADEDWNTVVKGLGGGGEFLRFMDIRLGAYSLFLPRSPFLKIVRFQRGNGNILALI